MTAGHHHHGEAHAPHSIERAEIARLAFAAFSIGLVWSAPAFPSAVRIFAIAAALVAGYPIYRAMLEDIMRLRMTMELSMAIALFAAMAIGEYLTTLIIIFFVLAAEILEHLTVARGRSAIGTLLAMLPDHVTVRRDGRLEEISAEEIHAGEIVVIRPGARVPVDGTVVAGHSFVDQSAITGESMPVEKVAGEPVFAGTFNQSGAMDVRAERIGRDTAFGRIIETVEHADASRAPIQKIADRLAGYLVIFALGCAAVTFLVTRDARSTISVVIVAGACGIAAGTPLAILGAIGSAARNGIIVKGGIPLQQLATVDTVVLDKTGTLTRGQPEVIAIEATKGSTERAVLETAAMAERTSEHPLGRAILRRADADGVAAAEPDEFHYLPGLGIACMKNGAEILAGNRALLKSRGVPLDAASDTPASEILISSNKRLLGRILLADTVRPEAADAARDLAALGIRTVVLSGDAPAITAAIASELGIANAEAGLLPDEKLARIDGLRDAGRRVAMIGDGINDAPALTRADVGVAMGSGTDVARECADIVLIGNDLRKFVAAIRSARRCLGVIRANFIGTLLVDSAGLVLAACGMLSPLLAAFIHVSSELVFILNSARLASPSQET